eukprot:scaffold3228_cov104-Skeletonema_marinoi.AAC.4
MGSSLRSLTALVLFVVVHSFSIGQPHLSATRSATDLSLSSSNVQSSTTTSGSSAVRSFRPSTPIDSELQLQLLSFYRFVPISNPAAIRDALFDQLILIPGVRGTVYVASEGINAQFSVPVGDQLRSLLQTF